MVSGRFPSTAESRLPEVGLQAGKSLPGRHVDPAPARLLLGRLVEVGRVEARYLSDD